MRSEKLSKLNQYFGKKNDKQLSHSGLGKSSETTRMSINSGVSKPYLSSALKSATLPRSGEK